MKMSNYFNEYIIKYAEIGVKGKNRYIFEDALIRQMKFALADVDGEFNISKSQGRIYLSCEGDFDNEEVENALMHVFGIAGICPVIHVEDEGEDKLKADVLDYIRHVYSDDPHFTFKVHARRARKSYPIPSMELNADLGEAILDAFEHTSVEIRNPEVMITVEIREQIYIYSKIIPGPGGMPVGTAGKAMLLLSGGIDSPVAGYMIAKRGVTIEAVYFHAPPYTSERAKQKVVDLGKLISKYCGPIKLHVINFTDLQLLMYEKCPHDELTIIMRRYMMRIAETIANQTGCLGLITGESIGQVASQTMQSLMCTNAVCSMPVFRPCIGMDKQEIIDISEKIDTYETSILPFEDCCTIFVAKHPVTKPLPHIIERSESKIAIEAEELIKIALETEEIVYINGKKQD